MDIKVKLSTLWIVVMLNLIFADILTIIMELVNKNIIDIIGSDAGTTMAIAAIITNIPILMVYCSRTLPRKTNRVLNIIAAILTCIYIIGGGTLKLYYVICASIEVLMLMVIIWTSWKWDANEKQIIPS